MLTKFGQTGAINLGKAVPLVGGVIGGAFDGTTTYAIGRVAKRVFVTPDGTSDAEQAEGTNIIEGFSHLLFTEGDDQDDALYWGTPQERHDRSTS